MPAQAIPPGSESRLRLGLVLEFLPEDVVNADITIKQYSDAADLPISNLNAFAGDLANVLYKIPKDGQAEHFMAYEGQNQFNSFLWGLEKIFGNTNRAIQLFRDWPPASNSKFRGFDSNEDASQYDKEVRYARKVADPLAHGIHPLQDSFSPSHVERDKDTYKIRTIKVWRTQDEKEHKEGDKDKDGKWGDAAQDATEMLLNYFLWSVLSRREEAKNARNQLLDKYFRFEPIPQKN